MSTQECRDRALNAIGEAAVLRTMANEGEVAYAVVQVDILFAICWALLALSDHDAFGKGAEHEG